MPLPPWAATACLALAALQQAREERPAMPIDIDDALLTVAERSDFRATSLHADVLALLDALAAASPLVRRGSLGTTSEGRDIPWITIADPPVATAEEAAASGKTRVFVFANIHAGEVCGKEGLLMLARQILLAPDAPEHRALLEHLVLVFAPIYNGDGNERISTTSRPEQDGPEQGQGIRANAMGLDLNRDYMKVEAPETAAMLAFLSEWEPHLVFDLHTTDGSFHRYLLTYAPPLNPEGPGAPIGFVRDRMLPAVSARLLARTGQDTFLYGNFEAAEPGGDDHAVWATYSAQPRFGAQYHGLRGHMSILTEAYSHAPFRERVLVQLEFLRECLAFAAEHAEPIRRTVEQAWATAAQGGPRTVGFRHVLAAADEPAVIKGWVETKDESGKAAPTSEPRDYEVRHDDHFVPTLEVVVPRAYLLPPGHDAVLANLRRHGLQMQPWQGGSAPTPVEVYRIDAITRAEQPFEGHRLVSVEATLRRESRSLGPDWTVVPVAQSLGTLAVYLLEPQSDDGLLAWNAFDATLAEGQDFPVLRLPME